MRVIKKITETSDIVEELQPHSEDELPIVQYLRPNGQKRMMFAPVGKEYVEKARGLELSVEWLPNGKVVLYGKRKSEPDEKEITELADNSPTDREPTIVLRKLIDRLTHSPL